MAARDPYTVLGVPPTAGDADLRAAYRRLVQLHHPDHNGGSAESARRFEEIQDAYAAIRRGDGGRPPPPPPPPRASETAGRTPDPDVEARIADLERELADARAARERADRAARDAAREARAAAAAADRRSPPTDEELGYVTTDDSFAKIFTDAGAKLSDLLGGGSPEERRATERVGELLEELGLRLQGRSPRRREP